MGKLSRRGAEAREYTPPVETLHACKNCGWEFETRNRARIYFDPLNPHKYRREPRQAISVRSGNGFVLLCDDCYERMLWETKQHSRQQFGGLASELYHESLFAEPANLLTDVQKADARARLHDLTKRMAQQERVQRIAKAMDPSGHD